MLGHRTLVTWPWFIGEVPGVKLEGLTVMKYRWPIGPDMDSIALRLRIELRSLGFIFFLSFCAV